VHAQFTSKHMFTSLLAMVAFKVLEVSFSIHHLVTYYSTSQKRKGEKPLPSLSPTPSLNSKFLNGMRLRLGNGIFPCYVYFSMNEYFNCEFADKFTNGV